MTTVNRLQTVRYALHTDNTTFNNTPGTLLPLQLVDDGASFLPRQRTPIERPLRSLGGRRFPHIYGAQDLADLVAVCEFKGVNNNTGGAVADWEAKMEQGYLLASLFGAVAPATTGSAPTVVTAGSSGSTGTLVVSSTVLVNGEVIAFPIDEGGYQIMRVASGGGTTTVVGSHQYYGTPTNGGTIIRLAVYTVDDDLTLHTHAFFSAEGENWRRDYFGCVPMSMSLAMPNTGLVQMTSTFSPTTWADVAEADPAFAAPTAGEPIVMDGVTFVLGTNTDGTMYRHLVGNLTINYSTGAAMRETASATNGKLGGVCGTGEGKMFSIEGEIEIGETDIGDLTAFTESDVTEATGIKQNGTNVQAGDISFTRRLALMVGAGRGRLMYVYLPEADFRASVVVSGALTKLRFTAMGTGAIPAVFAVG